MVADEPAATESTRHLGEVHGADGDQDTDSKPADEATTLEHSAVLLALVFKSEKMSDIRKRVGTTLKGAAEHSKESTQLDVGLSTKELARPHHKEGADSTAGAEDTVGRRDGGGCNAVVPRLTLGGKTEVTIPSWLANGTRDDRSTVTVGLVDALESPMSCI